MGLALDVCQACRRVQYPSRAVCEGCLSGDLAVENVAGEGIVLSWTIGHISALPAFKDQLPLYLGRIKLTSGVRVLAMMDTPCAIGARVQVSQNAQTGILHAKTL